MNSEVQILLGLETGLLKGLHSLCWASEKLQVACEFTAISTVIQSNDEDLGASLRVVIKAMTSLEGGELIGFIKEIETEFLRQVTSLESLRIYLLTFGQTVIITPKLTLPHPVMIEQPGWLYCSWEVWKGYRHPVLELSLERLLAQHPVTNVEFVGQGKMVLRKLTNSNQDVNS